MGKIIAYVPIKEQSERVKNKNTREIKGKPLFYWLLNTLSQAKIIDKVIVNTDTENMREKISSYFSNIEIIIRPQHLKDGKLTGDDLIKNDLELFSYDDIIFLSHVTNPLLSVDTVEKAINEFKNNDCDYLLSVIATQCRCFYKNKEVNHDIKNMRNTQDLEPVMAENSSMCIFTRSESEKNNSRYGENPYMFPMPMLESGEIDYEEDWELTKLIMENLTNK